MCIRIKTALFALLLACACSQNALAANWEWGSDFATAANWSDNPALSDNDLDPPTTFRVVLIYNGQIERLSQGRSWVFSPRVTRDYYPDRDFADLESTDIFLPGSFRFARQRTSFSLGYNLSRQNVLSDETTISDTGGSLLNSDDTLYRASLAPGFTWVMSEKDQISLGVNFSISDYDLEFTNRADSQGGGINGSYSRSLTQRQSLGFSVNVGKFKSENKRNVFFGFPPTLVPVKIINESSSYNFTVDYGFSLSSTSSLGVKFGLQNSTTDNETSELDTGQVLPLGFGETEFGSTTYDISYRKTTERGEFSLVASRRIVPSSNGQPQDKYDIALRGKIKFSGRLSGRYTFSAFDQQNIIFSATDGEFNSKTRFYNADFRLNWALTRKWRLNGSYRFRQRDREAGINTNESIVGTGHQIGVGIAYLWKTIQK
jgi:hypothetical protein